MSSDLDTILYKVNSSLLEKGIVTEPNYRHSTNSNYMNTEENKNKDYQRALNSNELQIIRGEMNANFEKLRKELENKSPYTNRGGYSYVESLPKYQNESQPQLQDTSVVIQIQQLWIKLNEMSNEINSLKTQSTENKIICTRNNTDIKEIQLKNDNISKKMNSLVINNDSQKLEDRFESTIKPKIESLEHQMKTLLLKVSEIDKQENELCLSVNKLNNNTIIIDGNVKKLFTRTQENTEEIELLKKQFNDCNNNIEILQKNNKVNNTNSIEPTLLEQYKIEINKQIQKLSEDNQKQLEQLNDSHKKSLTDIKLQMNNENKQFAGIYDAKVNDLNNQMNSLNKNVQILMQSNSNIEQISKEFADLKEDNENKIKSLQEKNETTVNSLRVEIEDKIKNISSVNNTNDTLFKVEEELKKEIESVKTSNNDEIQKINKELENMKKSNDISKDIQMLKEEKDKEMQSLQQKQTELSITVDNLSKIKIGDSKEIKEIYEREKQLKDDYELNLKDILNRIKQNENNIKILYDNMEELNRVNEHLKTDITTTFNQLNDWQNQLVGSVNQGIDSINNIPFAMAQPDENIKNVLPQNETKNEKKEEEIQVNNTNPKVEEKKDNIPPIDQEKEKEDSLLSPSKEEGNHYDIIDFNDVDNKEITPSLQINQPQELLSKKLIDFDVTEKKEEPKDNPKENSQKDEENEEFNIEDLDIPNDNIEDTTKENKDGYKLEELDLSPEKNEPSKKETINEEPQEKEDEDDWD